MFARGVWSWRDRRAGPGPVLISCCDFVACTDCRSRRISFMRARIAAKSSAVRGLFTFLPPPGLVLNAAQSPANRRQSESSWVNFPKQVSAHHPASRRGPDPAANARHHGAGRRCRQPPDRRRRVAPAGVASPAPQRASFPAQIAHTRARECPLRALPRRRIWHARCIPSCRP
jgi:hypothetical protein